MAHDDIAISVRNLTKTYRLFGHPGDRIKQFFSLGLKQYHREFTALNDVSFDIKKGETVGIIGRNGSGKSTLLQLICGILKPTSGTVQVNGRVSALLELGAGFNPEFTGRENVYFQGALMGFTKAQMDERFDEIAVFADIGEFIDQPVRTYSSGMFVRLAFSVAVSVDPDILVIDEALAVGDMAFQSRCFARMRAIRENGGTIVFVTHAMEQVAHHCKSTYLLDKGKLSAGGATATTLAAYLASTEDSFATHTSINENADLNDLVAQHPCYSNAETRWGDGKASIQAVQVSQGGASLSGPAIQGQPIEIQLTIRFQADVINPIFGLTIKSPSDALIYSVNSQQLSFPSRDGHAGDLVAAVFCLTPFLDQGTFLFSFGVASESPNGILPHDRRYDVLRLNIEAPHTLTGELEMFPEFKLIPLTS